MQRFNHWVKIAILFLLCPIAPFCLHAQQDRRDGIDRLDKKVRLKIDRGRVEDVLSELAKEGYFTFSYNSSILNKDRMVTLKLRESTLREALELLLGNGYAYGETGDYVVIRRSEGVRAKVMLRTKVMKVRIGYAKDTLDPRPVKERVVPRAKKYALVEGPSPEIEARKQVVRNIIADMVTEQIIKDKDSFNWFGLDNTQFIVDGRVIADSLRSKFQAKFIKPDGMGYYYGPVSIRGTGTFFDKSDIYP
jgi:hypothetical protein